MKIADSTILVTGANRGLGKALVEEALRRGAKRIYAGARQPFAHADRRVTPLMLDITNAAQIRAAAEQVDALDILINNAGISLQDDLGDRAALERLLAVNLFGTYDVTQAFVPALARSRSAIVNILSLAALAAVPFDSALLDIEGRRILPLAIVARTLGRTRHQRPCGLPRPHRHRHDTGSGRSEGLSGVRRASDLRRRGERGRGDLPRSDVGGNRGGLAQRCRQAASAPVCRVRQTNARPVRGLNGRITAPHRNGGRAARATVNLAAPWPNEIKLDSWE